MTEKLLCEPKRADSEEHSSEIAFDIRRLSGFVGPRRLSYPENEAD